MKVSRGFSATFITIVGNASVSTASRSSRFARATRRGSSSARVGGAVSPEPRPHSAGVRRSAVSSAATIAGGRSVPSSFPVTANSSIRPGTRLLPNPKLSCAVRNGVASVRIGSAKVAVRCTGPEAPRSGDQPSSFRGSRQPAGGCRASQRAGGDPRDLLQLVEVDLIAGNGVRRHGDGCEHERALGGRIVRRARPPGLAAGCLAGRVPARRRGAARARPARSPSRRRGARGGGARRRAAPSPAR